MPFTSCPKREPELINKGGDEGVKIDDKVDKVYDCLDTKLKQFKKIDIPKFGKNSNRNSTWGNMYRHDRDLSPDFYDSVKIANDEIKLKQKRKSYLDLKKQKKRDCMEHLKGNDFYRNVQRDNERADFLKNLLSTAGEETP